MSKEETRVLVHQKISEILNTKNFSFFRLEDVPNNSVYIVSADAGEYIFKIYNQRDWPEDGKLLFVQAELAKRGIPCAEILCFDRSDPRFPEGCLLEKKLPGVTADRSELSTDETETVYRQLAGLMTDIHKIPVQGYGYMGSGTGCYDHLSEFLADVFDENLDKLGKRGSLSADTVNRLRDAFHGKVCLCPDNASVLCHGDLSLKNLIIHGGDITLIDWDDATAYSFIGDIVRLCVWMRLHYGSTQCLPLKEVFLQRYFSLNPDKEEIFNRHRLVFEAYFALDYMAYYDEGDLYHAAEDILHDSMKDCAVWD